MRINIRARTSSPAWLYEFRERFIVTLDGVKVADCFAADEDDGWVRVYVQNDAGQKIVENDEPVTRTIRGSVVIQPFAGVFVRLNNLEFYPAGMTEADYTVVRKLMAAMRDDGLFTQQIRIERYENGIVVQTSTL